MKIGLSKSWEKSVEKNLVFCCWWCSKWPLKVLWEIDKKKVKRNEGVEISLVASLSFKSGWQKWTIDFYDKINLLQNGLLPPFYSCLGDGSWKDQGGKQYFILVDFVSSDTANNASFSGSNIAISKCIFLTPFCTARAGTSLTSFLFVVHHLCLILVNCMRGRNDGLRSRAKS